MGELVVTNKGKELITKLIEGSETINFTRIKTSIHDYSSDNLEDLTDIEEVRQESMISSVEKTDNTVVEVIAMINNNALQEGYYIKTIGLYAKDSNDNEILYGVSIAGKYADYMPAYGGKTVSSISYKLITKVDNAEQVNIEINPAAIPTITQINELKQVVIEFKDLTDEHIKSHIISQEGSHGLKYDEASQKFKYKKDGTWNDINTSGNTQGLEEHTKTNVTSEEGSHGLRYHDNKLQHYNKDSQSWENVTQDVLVTGLTASVLKVGTTAVIKTESEELKRVTGTFTNDANAVASDIISGKTAYVNGNKVTGNIATRTGTISISNPSISGNNLVTPTIPSGYYNNAKISFNRNNLYPESIKAGTNLYGVVGTFTNDATATAGDIASGKTAYVRGQKITGTFRKEPKPIAAVAMMGSGNDLGLIISSYDNSLLPYGRYQAKYNNGVQVQFLRRANIYVAANFDLTLGSGSASIRCYIGTRLVSVGSYSVNSGDVLRVEGTTYNCVYNNVFLIMEYV